MPKARDRNTLDLFRDVEPAPVVERFAEELVRTPDQAGRVARAVTATLKEYDGERAAIAKEMTAYLGETVTEAMLNQYASQANSKHNIPAHRLIALAVIAGDARLINALLMDTGLIAVPAKYEALIAREMAKEQVEALQRRVAAADAQWRANR